MVLSLKRSKLGVSPSKPGSFAQKNRCQGSLRVRPAQ